MKWCHTKDNCGPTPEYAPCAPAAFCDDRRGLRLVWPSRSMNRQRFSARRPTIRAAFRRRAHDWHAYAPSHIAHRTNDPPARCDAELALISAEYNPASAVRRPARPHQYEGDRSTSEAVKSANQHDNLPGSQTGPSLPALSVVTHTPDCIDRQPHVYVTLAPSPLGDSLCSPVLDRVCAWRVTPMPRVFAVSVQTRTDHRHV